MSLGLAERPLAQVGFTVADVARSLPFYRDVLGLPLLFEVPGMAFFQANGFRVMIGSLSPDKPGGGTVVYFDAPDIDEAVGKLDGKAELVGKLETVQRTEAGDRKLQIFRDPDGNMLALLGLVPN